MKNIQNRTTDIGELNVALGKEFDTPFWSLIFSKIGYNEIVFDAEEGTVTYPDFIPIEDMIRDVLDRLDEEQTIACEVCRQVFDINEEDGIFGDPQRLKRFLCRRCSEVTSARDFYYRYLKVGG